MQNTDQILNSLFTEDQFKYVRWGLLTEHALEWEHGGAGGWMGRGSSGGGQLKGDELLEPLQVLGVELNVVVAGPFHPQGLHSSRAALVDGQAVREVDHLILCAVNDQHGGRHLRHLINAAEQGGERERERERKNTYLSHGVSQALVFGVVYFST